jgi:hypothetical protein
MALKNFVKFGENIKLRKVEFLTFQPLRKGWIKILIRFESPNRERLESWNKKTGISGKKDVKLQTKVYKEKFRKQMG